MTEPTYELLKTKAEQIRGAANDIIGEIDPKEIEDAVNWADLACTEVWVQLVDGGPYWMATVEEASPGATKLAAHIQAELQRRGFDVWVRCEW